MTTLRDAQVAKAEGSPTPSGEAAGGYDAQATARKLGSAIKLLLIFCSTYFIAALIATPAFRHIANFELLGLPLAFHTGILVFVVGMVVTRMCLNQDEKA